MAGTLICFAMGFKRRSRRFVWLMGVPARETNTKSSGPLTFALLPSWSRIWNNGCGIGMSMTRHCFTFSSSPLYDWFLTAMVLGGMVSESAFCITFQRFTYFH